LDSVNEEFDIDAEALADEIARYLAAVDVFRALGSEPVWRPESKRRADTVEVGEDIARELPAAH
jgi:hypothetical protein